MKKQTSFIPSSLLPLIPFLLLLLIPSSLFSQTLPSYLPTNGLVAWYPFNGNANDESGNGNNFVNSNFSFGNSLPELDSAANTYGINSEYFLISPSLFPSTATYTFKLTYNFQSGNSPLVIWLGSSLNNSLLINISQQNISFGTSSGGNEYWSTPTLGMGFKNEILVKVSYTGQYYFIVNDSTFGPFYWTAVEFPCLVSFNSYASSECSSPSFMSYYEPNNSSIFIDDVILYNRFLNDQEISAIQTQTPVSEIIANTQAPPGIPYQAVVRNSNGQVAANTAVTAKFTLHQNTTDGAVEYQETHALTTNAQGLISTVLGQGTAVQGTFAGINWANTTKFMQVEMDLGNGYVDMGTQQLMSVPYALYAANGPQGAQGPQGPQGAQGPAGPPANLSVSFTGDTLYTGSGFILVPGISAANFPPAVLGCTDNTACNYNSAATQSDNSCLYLNATCDDGNANTTNDIINSSCVCVGGLPINSLAIGQDYQGGKVAYIFQPSDAGYIAGENHGVVISSEDVGLTMWGCNGINLFVGNNLVTGNGYANTYILVNHCLTAGIAARLCFELVLNGYDDWYLPSLSELTQVYNNKDLFGIFQPYGYWTSSETNPDDHWGAAYINFGTNYIYGVNRETPMYVRAIRYF